MQLVGNHDAVSSSATAGVGRLRLAERKRQWFRKRRTRGGVGIAACLAASIVASLPKLAASDPGVSARSQPVVVVALDPGHGGTNLGAAGPGRGIFEKNVTLALALRMKVLLESPAQAGGVAATTSLESARFVPTRGGVAARAEGAADGFPVIRVVLCRASDHLVPIRQRARCAVENDARIFMSLHANAVPLGVHPASQSGFEVFVLGPGEVEEDAALAALRERLDADAALASHQVRAAAEQSVRLAGVLAKRLTRAMGLSGWRGVKQSGADLDVLRGTNAASTLVEIGFLSHPEEGGRLATARGREPLAHALVDGIREFAWREYGAEGDPEGDRRKVR